jgi:hypothetical protein
MTTSTIGAEIAGVRPAETLFVNDTNYARVYDRRRLVRVAHPFRGAYFRAMQ